MNISFVSFRLRHKLTFIPIGCDIGCMKRALWGLRCGCSSAPWGGHTHSCSDCIYSAEAIIAVRKLQQFPFAKPWCLKLLSPQIIIFYCQPQSTPDRFKEIVKEIILLRSSVHKYQVGMKFCKSELHNFLFVHQKQNTLLWHFFCVLSF